MPDTGPDEAAIVRLVQAYALAADAYDGAALAQCFTRDGILDRSDNRFTGQDAIAKAIVNPGGRVRRHLFLPPVLLFPETDIAEGRGYCLYCEYDSAARAARPFIPIDYHDHYRRTAAGWRLSSRRVRPSFS